jgi:LAS superfamily LD-carboxypeptidase LdcB
MKKLPPYVTPTLILGCTLVILTSILIYGYVKFRNLTETHASLQNEYDHVAATTIPEKDARILELEAQLADMTQKYALSEENGTELLELLADEKNRNEDFEDQIDNISGTVGKLDKLSKIDPELLMKYSKVYFLNENYAPEKIGDIPVEFRSKTDESEYVHAQVLPFLLDLLRDAEEDGVMIDVLSGYRSFDEQRALKSTYTVQYGSGANTFSADQGYSEHQLGTAIDFSSPEIGGTLNGFENTKAFAWLSKYAYKYGFVLSYPKDNAYYVYEPWHWRFVGEKLADELHDENVRFYDMDQREIDSYLISLFD